MLRLYNASSGGSAEIDLVQREDSERWERLRRNAVRVLRDTGELDAADLLESLAFEMWSGTNSFGDEFDLLHLPAPPRTYQDFEKQVDEKQDAWKYGTIANTLEKLHANIRFITVDVEMDRGVESVSVPDQDYVGHRRAGAGGRGNTSRPLARLLDWSPAAMPASRNCSSWCAGTIQP